MPDPDITTPEVSTQESQAMAPAVAPKRTRVKVKSEGGKFLFLYHVDRHVIELHQRGLTYVIPILDLVEFGRTSDRDIFRVHPTYEQPADDEDTVRQGFE